MGHLLFMDFETYYDQGNYTLRKMTPAEYILDPRFETIIVAVKADNGPHEIIDGPDFPAWLAQFPPQDTTTVTFNALFDNSILAWHYGYVPNMMLDAMAMARALDGHLLSRFSLATISEHLGLVAKGDTISNVTGMRRADIMRDAQLWNDYKAYALRDNMNAEQIFLRYYPRMPRSERRLMDMVLRCAVEPRFVIDAPMLNNHIKDIQLEKAQLIAAAGSVDRSLIMSSPKFEAELKKLGVNVEYKDSPTAKHADGTPKQVPAFAKTDEFMENLQNDPDPRVAALAAARVGLKSTLEETRSATLWRIAQLPWQNLPDGNPRLYSGGTCPIPLRYGGAHTGRLAGDWKMNMQNMPTVRGSKGKSKLRLSLKAPPGHHVVTIDLGQIEARLVAWICGENQLLKEFAQKLDPYNQLAGAIFGRPVNRKLVGTVDEVMGFIGKTGILGLGYGCGKEKFDGMVIRSARAMEVDISQIYNRAVGDHAWKTYRGRYPNIPKGWYELDDAVKYRWSTPAAQPFDFGPVRISYGKVKLPNNMFLEYADPAPPEGGHKSWTYRYGNKRHTLYGAKLLENIVQALARIVVMNAALRIRDHGKGMPSPWAYRFVHQAHDELVYIIPDSELATAKQMIHAEMVRPPTWGRDIPLVADINDGLSYGEAK